MVFDPWQEIVLQAAMGERADGRWAARQVALSTPRQNGKTEIIVARALAGVILFGETLVVVSAHRLDTVREIFTRMQYVCENTPGLHRRVSTYGTAMTREYLKFTGGATVRFKTRSAGGARGFSADCVILDEAQILPSTAWASMLPTMSARPNAQVWLLGTPPTPEDDGDVWTRIRDKALTGAGASRSAYLEWSAGRDDDPADPATWAKANPAYPLRITAEAIETERDGMTGPEFARERLGIWPGASAVPPVIDPAAWGRLKGAPPQEGRRAYGVRFSADGARVALAVAVTGDDEAPVFVEVVDTAATSAGLGWLADWLAARWSGSSGIVIDGRSGAGALVEALLARGVRSRMLHRPTTDEVVTAHAGLLDAVNTGALRHAGQPGLAQSVDAAGRRTIGNLGGWGFTPRYPGGDVTPLEAVTLALFGARAARRPGRAAIGHRSRSSGRTAVVL